MTTRGTFVALGADVPDNVRRAVDAAFLASADRFADQIDRVVQAGVSSPIEIQMLAALMAVDEGFQVPLWPIVVGKRPDEVTETAGRFLIAQAPIGPYRVDFLLCLAAARGLLAIAIECDGHEFHDATPQAAARDKSRDRYLHGRVDKVLRFTGREITRDPIACAREAYGVMLDLMFRGAARG